MDALKKDDELLANIKSHLPELTALLQEMNSPWFYEDLIYRFYHQSFKVYTLQAETKKIADALKSLAPAGATFCKEFEEIYSAGASGKQFEMAHNQNWTAHTRAFVEAFFHAKFFLEMAVKYGKELEAAPTMLPSGWAALLCLYKMR